MLPQKARKPLPSHDPTEGSFAFGIPKFPFHRDPVQFLLRCEFLLRFEFVGVLCGDFGRSPEVQTGEADIEIFT